MLNATITIRKIYPGASPNAPSRAMDDSGGYWKLWQKERSMVAEGGTYQVGYKTEMYQGKEQRTITAVLPAASVPTHPSPQPGQFISVPSAGVPMAPAPSAINRDELIFVEALIKPWMEKIQAGDQLAVEHAVNVLRGVFANTFGRMPKWKRPDVIETGPAPAPRPDDVPFNDEIPY